jgi:hypothetical protein
MVGTGRFELPTPRTPSECSTRLSHVPTRKEPAASSAADGVNQGNFITCGAVSSDGTLLGADLTDRCWICSPQNEEHQVHHRLDSWRHSCAAGDLCNGNTPKPRVLVIHLQRNCVSHIGYLVGAVFSMGNPDWDQATNKDDNPKLDPCPPLQLKVCHLRLPFDFLEEVLEAGRAGASSKIANWIFFSTGSMRSTSTRILCPRP